jgi:hypothetical protein
MESKDYDIIAIQNIDTEDFVFEYDKSKGNPPYTIPAGEVKRFPRFLARHAVKHLIDKILTKRDARINNENAREDLLTQIVIDEETFQSGVKKTEAEMLQEKVEAMNKPSELDKILAQKKEIKPQQPPTLPTTEKVVEKFDGLEEEVKGDEEDTTDEPNLEPITEVRAVPSRREIYAYAEKQGMTLDPDTTKKLDKMNVPQLLEELGDPRDALI